PVFGMRIIVGVSLDRWDDSVDARRADNRNGPAPERLLEMERAPWATRRSDGPGRIPSDSRTRGGGRSSGKHEGEMNRPVFPVPLILTDLPSRNKSHSEGNRDLRGNLGALCRLQRSEGTPGLRSSPG